MGRSSRIGGFVLGVSVAAALGFHYLGNAPERLETARGFDALISPAASTPAEAAPIARAVPAQAAVVMRPVPVQASLSPSRGRSGIGGPIGPNRPGPRAVRGVDGRGIADARGTAGAGRHGFAHGRFGYGGFGYDGADGAGFGLGLDTLPDAVPPDDGRGRSSGYGYGYGVPPVIPAFGPPPCIRPLIIKIGSGLRHKAKTRVTYGSPPCEARVY